MATTIRLLPISPDNPFPVGRHVEHWDESRRYAYPHDDIALKRAIWPHHGRILNQLKLGSCTCNAELQVLETGPLWRKGFTVTEHMAVDLYELATQLDGIPGQWPPTDTGSSGVGAAKAAVEKGYITAYQHVFGIDHAKAAIQTTPFMVGTTWTNDMFTPDSSGLVHPTGGVAGGHEYVCLGWDPATDLWTFLNSWGNWGIGMDGVATHGLFRMHGSDFAGLLADQGDITVPVR